MVAILHLHLLHPIMLGNKKCRDVQFYTEVGDVVQTLDGGRRSMVSLLGCLFLSDLRVCLV